MDDLEAISRHVFFDNDSWHWLIAAGLGLAILLAGITLRSWVLRRHRTMAETHVIELLELPFEVASKTTLTFVGAVALFVGLSSLKLPTELRVWVVRAFTIVGFSQLGIWASSAVLAWIVVRRKAAATGDRAAAGSLGIIGFVMRVLVWTLVVLLMLDNLGVDITALVAGLGVGGIAVALAVQNVLGDLFASLSITLDRPFVVGDTVQVGDFVGSVEQIGVKSTRLRSVNGEQIVIANADLLSSRLRNYGRMHERRVLFQLAIPYETPRAKLERIPALIRGVIERHERARFARSHFAGFGSAALSFETVYHVQSPDYDVHMDLQQSIYFGIHEAFEEEGIEFAPATQKLVLANDSLPVRPELRAHASASTLS